MTTVAETNPSFYKHTLKWVIANPREYLEFSLKANQTNLTSPEVEFSLPNSPIDPTENKLVWNIGIKLSSDSRGDRHIQTTFCISSRSEKISRSFGVQYSQSLHNENDKELARRTPTNKWFTADAVASADIKAICCSLDMISTKKLIISCTCQGYDITLPPSFELDVPPAYSDDLSLELEKDRKVGTTTDAILKIGKQEFKVHKCVLALQSDFFKARFSDRWEGKEQIVVDMNDPDLDTEILEALISGTYTGKVSDLDLAVKLLPVVDKYQFFRLKRVCEAVIASHLNMDNVLTYFAHAKQHGAQELQKRCDSLLRGSGILDQ